MPLTLPRERCALTAPFHPCRARRAAVCFLWRFPWGRPRRTLSGAVSPWSPDFPPRARRGGHPAGWRHLDRRERARGQWESARGLRSPANVARIKVRRWTFANSLRRTPTAPVASLSLRSIRDNANNFEQHKGRYASLCSGAIIQSLWSGSYFAARTSGRGVVNLPHASFWQIGASCERSRPYSLPRPERSRSGSQAQAISKMLPFGIGDMSHRRAVLSDDPVSTRMPSGLKATELTEPSCPLKARISLPVAASHRRAVSSNDPVSTRMPSEPKATEIDKVLMPLEGADFLARHRVPQAGGVIR